MVSTVEEVVANYKALKITRGRKVVEIRPQVDPCSPLPELRCIAIPQLTNRPMALNRWTGIKALL